jgi:hypothetical protein
LWPYLVLVAIPAAAFILPYVLDGRVLMAGDNLQQNFPLHVLVGHMLRHGQLPFWNPYIFSGTPLMADFNAGAFYPLMGFFIVLSPNVAWIATEVVLFSAIAIGMYVFLRAMRLSPAAGVLAAATFAFSGTVLSQVNHVDMTEGFVAIPWMLLSVLHIVRDGRWRWSVLLGIAYATVILGGAPEAMLDEALLVIAYAAMSAGIDWTRWWRVLSRCAAGAGLALSLAAIQWLPGLEAIGLSQRAGTSLATAGSFPTPFNIFWLVPYLDGNYGNFHEARFFGQYNLPEVGVYLGILPLIAVITLLNPRWPSRMPQRDRLTWYVVGAFGYLLALGGNTPLEHLFNALPLYGHQRLQSRNMIIVATAVCVLFAGWIDRADGVERTHGVERTDGETSDKALLWYERVMALVPAGIVAGLALWAFVGPTSLVSVFAGVQLSPSYATTVRQATIVALCFCAGAAVVVWLRPWLAQPHWRWLVAVFVSIDIGLMGLTSQLTATPPNDLLSGTTPIQQLMARNLAPGGRILSYDPQAYASYPSSPQGVPDLNILANLPSVSGYASIVNGRYEAVTKTHEQGSLNVGVISGARLDQLNLQELVTLPEYFLLPLESMPRSIGDLRPVSQGFVANSTLQRGFAYTQNGIPYPYFPGPRPALPPGERASWFFGATLRSDIATLLFTQPVAGATTVRFGIVAPDGTTRWASSVSLHAGETSVTSHLPPGAGIGFTVQASGALPEQRAVVSAHGHPYELGGALSSVLTPGPWRQVAELQGYTIFTRTTPPTPILAMSASGKRLSVQVLSSSTKSEQLRVRTPVAATVVRSVAWDSGWTGSVSVNGAKGTKVPVKAFDLVQQIAVPPGNDVVTFRYNPPRLRLASVLSLGACAFLVILGLTFLVRHRRRRRRGRKHASGRGNGRHVEVIEPRTQVQELVQQYG